MRVRPGGRSQPAPTTPDPHPAPPRAGSFTAILGERAGPSPTTTAPPAATRKPLPTAPRKAPAAGAPATASPVRALLERTVSAERNVDTLLAAAARGKTFSPSELLALQTTVFRYSQAVEIVSRATDKLVGAVKQTLGTQV